MAYSNRKLRLIIEDPKGEHSRNLKAAQAFCIAEDDREKEEMTALMTPFTHFSNFWGVVRGPEAALALFEAELTSLRISWTTRVVAITANTFERVGYAQMGGASFARRLPLVGDMISKYSQEKKAPTDTCSEVSVALIAKNVERTVALNAMGIRVLSSSMVPVLKTANLEGFARALESRGDCEMGFCPTFSPALVEECCKRGIFPLAIHVGRGKFLFAPKLHVKRAVTQLGPTELINGFPPAAPNDSRGVFSLRRLGISSKLMRRIAKVSPMDVFVNREEDAAPVLDLIRRQHGENWLCGELRACLVFMFSHRKAYSTKVVFTAIRTRCSDSGPPLGPSSGSANQVEATAPVAGGELVAGEIGYIVGDIYCSATGGYCVSGAGSLQLGVVACVMMAAGCKLWDLGMTMEYKENALNTVNVPRSRWQQMVAERSTKPTTALAIDCQLMLHFKDGVDVFQLLEKSQDRDSR